MREAEDFGYVVGVDEVVDKHSASHGNSLHQ